MPSYGGAFMTPPLYKTVIIVWSKHDPENIELSELVYNGSLDSSWTHLSKNESTFVKNPELDQDWDGIRLFNRIHE